MHTDILSLGASYVDNFAVCFLNRSYWRRSMHRSRCRAIRLLLAFSGQCEHFMSCDNAIDDILSKWGEWPDICYEILAKHSRLFNG